MSGGMLSKKQKDDLFQSVIESSMKSGLGIGVDVAGMAMSFRFETVTFVHEESRLERVKSYLEKRKLRAAIKNKKETNKTTKRL